ncbi:MAG: hypothetical protein H6709_08955 [Kofleriaceae bacterium]|nr:hypothetical protein [Kofleriaceae bacterium]MCB9572199.1 hypothetical protein [Kofleriaceae bacterium]
MPARFEDIDLVFEEGSVQDLVANKIPYGANVDWSRSARGAAKVVGPGGTLRIHIWGASPEELGAIAEEFRAAGFHDVSTSFNQLIEGVR